MTVYNWFITALWIVFIVYWAVSAPGAKRTIGTRGRWRREGGLRLSIIVLVLLAYQVPAVHHALRHARLSAASFRPLAGPTGVALCALGVGLAIWARVHLGRNWGMPMSRKENPELVTTGPYRFVRHPIYSGILLAMLGSTLGASIIWLVPLVVSVAYFVYSARAEERLMLEQFPAQYRAYMQRTKMLLPFML
jgi:protein-S-isoprenylcysteine O-methyltransferase Ste14